ncbi:MAG: hypothetical protein OJF50_005185 [Nitrospira sp.]|nr:hypothetical protein [Nitrospira sp.]
MGQCSCLVITVPPTCIYKGPSGNNMRSGYTFCPLAAVNSIVSTQNFRHRPSSSAWQAFRLRQIGMASTETRVVLFAMSRTPPTQVDGPADRSDIAAGKSGGLWDGPHVTESNRRPGL